MQNFSPSEQATDSSLQLGGKPLATVFILDGNFTIGAHVRSNLSYLICLGRLIRPRLVSRWMFSPKRTIFLHACAPCSELPSYIISIHQTCIIIKKFVFFFLGICLLCMICSTGRSSCMTASTKSKKQEKNCPQDRGRDNLSK